MYILCSNPEETHEKAFQMLTDRGFKIVTPDQIVSGFDVDKISAAFVRASTQVTRQWLEQFPKLKFLLCASVGLDNIDREACKERSIQIFNAPAANSTAVAEHALTLILMLLKKINHHQTRLRNGGWRDLDYVNDELHGKTIGLVGCGAVGRKIAQLCHAFGVSSVLAYDPFANKELMQEEGITLVTLADLFASVDIVTVQVPLTPQTKNLITLSLLETMKPNGMIINVSRGQVIAEEDLILALKTGVIAGAGLDVFAQEPNVNPRLLELPNTVLTPHVGGFSAQARESMSLLPVQKLLTTVTGL